MKVTDMDDMEFEIETVYDSIRKYPQFNPKYNAVYGSTEFVTRIKHKIET